jgi:hypothetical protein
VVEVGVLGEDVVRLERQVRVLFSRSDGENDPIIAAEAALELHPVEVTNPHSGTLTLSQAPGWCRST